MCFGVVRPWQYSVVSKFGLALTSNSLGLSLPWLCSIVLRCSLVALAIVLCAIFSTVTEVTKPLCFPGTELKN